LLWFYIKSLTDQYFKFKPIYLFHFLPFVIVFIEHSINIYSLPSELKVYLDKTEIFKTWIIYPVIVVAVAIVTLGYLFWCWILVRQYYRKIQNYFSEVTRINLKWLRWLIIATLICYVLNDFTYIIDLFFNFASYSVLQVMSFMIASLFILFLGFYGHRQGCIFSTKMVEIDLSKTLQTTIIGNKLNTEEEQFIDSLLSYMRIQKPFLKPELTIAALSGELNVSPYYLSDILNNKLNLNFYDFVNRYRVDEFKLKLIDPAYGNISFSGIASDCGFNSNATFYRVFKKITGTTPNEYSKGFSRN
jgi:AraC-like DNA-binding protein